MATLVANLTETKTISPAILSFKEIGLAVIIPLLVRAFWLEGHHYHNHLQHLAQPHGHMPGQRQNQVRNFMH